jgi:hypothetical protein
MSTGDYWFTHVYKSQAAERIRAGEQERLAAEVRSAYREQQRAARLRRHQVRLTAKPDDLVEVASWATSPTEVSEVLLAVLIDIPPEDAAIVLTFEDAVLPLLNRHGGQLQRRLRAVDQSAELQIISFDSREAQEAFATDPSRLQLMRLLQAASSDNVFSTLQSPPLTMATADRFGGGLPKGENR